MKSTWHPTEEGKPGPIYIYPGEVIEVHGPDDADVIGNLEMNESGKLAFFRTDGIMLDLSGTLPLDTIFARIMRKLASRDRVDDDKRKRADWCRLIQQRRDSAEVFAGDFEENMICCAVLAIAAIESSRRKRIEVAK